MLRLTARVYMYVMHRGGGWVNTILEYDVGLLRCCEQRRHGLRLGVTKASHSAPGAPPSTTTAPAGQQQQRATAPPPTLHLLGAARASRTAAGGIVPREPLELQWLHRHAHRLLPALVFHALRVKFAAVVPHEVLRVWKQQTAGQRR